MFRVSIFESLLDFDAIDAEDAAAFGRGAAGAGL